MVGYARQCVCILPRLAIAPRHPGPASSNMTQVSGSGTAATTSTELMAQHSSPSPSPETVAEHLDTSVVLLWAAVNDRVGPACTRPSGRTAAEARRLYG